MSFASTEPKTARFVMALSPREKKMLIALAKERGKSGGEIVRELIVAEHEAVVAYKDAGKSRSKKNSS